MKANVHSKRSRAKKQNHETLGPEARTQLQKQYRKHYRCCWPQKGNQTRKNRSRTRKCKQQTKNANVNMAWSPNKAPKLIHLFCAQENSKKKGRRNKKQTRARPPAKIDKTKTKHNGRQHARDTDPPFVGPHKNNQKKKKTQWQDEQIQQKTKEANVHSNRSATKQQNHNTPWPKARKKLLKHAGNMFAPKKQQKETIWQDE